MICFPRGDIIQFGAGVFSFVLVLLLFVRSLLPSLYFRYFMSCFHWDFLTEVMGFGCILWVRLHFPCFGMWDIGYMYSVCWGYIFLWVILHFTLMSLDLSDLSLFMHAIKWGINFL